MAKEKKENVKKVEIPTQVTCRLCHGTGKDPDDKNVLCPNCVGRK